MTLTTRRIPAVTTLQSSMFTVDNDARYRRHISVRNIDNDPLAVHTAPKQRACRFLWENEGGVYPHYSYSACTILCRKRAQLDICGCHDHFMPDESEYKL
ncbi:hypothetical protein EVAR_103270_1 [Eumeta japonica]|uniref:Uncharacterized protein n=1 Tax=Eumeta variegata TaxID=151549 RepID=A0A4C1XPG7_EUMVA|nr:hypothetical protein EVAR_103270_1 [Eumeta japonica]